MKREVVQDFLNLPGIAGVALMDGRSRPYFCGVDQDLNFQQKEALVQGIQQVVETTPVDFQFFQFQFTGCQIYIYKLDHGIILLVLTSSQLIYSSYRQAIELLKADLQQDINGAIATFRLLAGNISLSDQTYRQQQAQTAAPDSEAQSSTVSDSPQPAQQGNGAQVPAAINPAIPSPPDSPAVPTSVSATVSVSPSLQDVLLALNHLSQFTTRYLGTTVVANYWNTTRPAIEWLNNFQIARSATISCTETAMPLTQFVTAEQHQWVREWVAAFIQRCAKVIREFPLLVKQVALDDRQKSLLLSDGF